MNIFKFILCLLFGLIFINAGLDKFLHYIPIPPLEPEILKVGEAFGTIKWLLPLVGFIEILGGILFIWQKTRALAVLILLPIMVGIFIHHIVFLPEGLIVPGILGIIYGWILWENKEKYKSLICSTHP